MNLRSFVRRSIACAAGVATVSVSGRARTENAPSETAPTPPAFELDELTIADLQDGMSSGKYTAR